MSISVDVESKDKVVLYILVPPQSFFSKLKFALKYVFGALPSVVQVNLEPRTAQGLNNILEQWLDEREEDEEED